MTDETPNAVAHALVGFLEEAPGVKSSTRLFAAVCIGLAGALAAVIGWYVWFTTSRVPPRTPDATVIAALVTGIGAFVAQGAVAIIRRTKVGDE